MGSLGIWSFGVGTLRFSVVVDGWFQWVVKSQLVHWWTWLQRSLQ